jgi:uncharacterized protein
VMERESFESDEIAELLNRHYVPIKVDREERPDVDRVYMTFVQATTGSGGWPMSVWLTPDRKPFFGGTYFPPDSRYGRPGFQTVLEKLAEGWESDRARIVESSSAILEELEKQTALGDQKSLLSEDAVASCYAYFRRSFDANYGGFGGAPKFPRPVSLNFLFRYHAAHGSDEALEMALATLLEMAKGGMNDQLGGGFHRYSVDERWFVPHFEKMLYDQAQLATSYLEAYQITRDPLYAKVAVDTFEYVLRDLSHPEGGFYSAEDADSAIDAANPGEKGEGAFYTWSRGEVESLAGAERAEWFAYRFGMEPEGNVVNDPQGEFTGKNILYQAHSIAETARRFGATEEEVKEGIHQVSRLLFEARAARVRPHLDDKVLTAWNGLMISSLAIGARTLEERFPELAQRYLEAAARAAEFVENKLRAEGSGDLLRRFRDGEAGVAACLDDYAFFVQALLDLYETTFEPDYLATAARITERQMELFEDRDNGGFYSSPEGASELVMRLKDDYDGAEPSGNSVTVLNLLRLARSTGNEVFRRSAVRTLELFASRLLTAPATVPQMIVAYMASVAKSEQVIVVGDRRSPETREFLHAIRRRFLPDTLVVLLPDDPEAPERRLLSKWLPALANMRALDGKTTAYVCQDFTCRLPVNEVERLDELLQ